MNDVSKIQKAIKFATKTHEVYQKQKRKGKDIAYITHPLTVGLILAHAGANDDVICAGILHDTMEDSIDDKKVSLDMLKERFGDTVAQLVLAVTETDKSLSWSERKKIAKEHIKSFSNEALFVKSADILSNIAELMDDYRKGGDQIFERFNAPLPKKENKIKNQIETINTIIEKWPENPLVPDLRYYINELSKLLG